MCTCICYWGRRLEFDFSFTDTGAENWFKKNFNIDFTILWKAELYEPNNFTPRLYSPVNL